MVSSAHTDRHAATMRALAERLGQPPVRQMVKAPGVSAVLRLTILYDAQQALDSVGTLHHSRVEGTALTMAYAGAFHNQALVYPILEDRYDALTQALSRARFDHLHDQPELPPYGLDLWMIERAAANFVHSIILAPATAEAQHGQIVAVIREHLPEALRIIPQEKA